MLVAAPGEYASCHENENERRGTRNLARVRVRKRLFCAFPIWD